MNFAVVLAGILAKYLEQLHNKGAQEAGKAIELVDAATLAVLQENARIKGVTLDWADPAQVQQFLTTLPVFTPIPEPPKK